MKVIVITPERIIEELEGEEVIIPTEAGVIGVRAGHIPLISPIKAGEVMIKNGKQQQSVIVAGGLVEVLPNRVRILADLAERVEEVHEAPSPAILERAEKMKAEAKDDHQLKEAQILIEHNLIRLKVAKRRKARGHHS